jgi:hypothetical protein
LEGGQGGHSSVSITKTGKGGTVKPAMGALVTPSRAGAGAVYATVHHILGYAREEQGATKICTKIEAAKNDIFSTA